MGVHRGRILPRGLHFELGPLNTSKFIRWRREKGVASRGNHMKAQEPECGELFRNVLAWGIGAATFHSPCAA